MTITTWKAEFYPNDETKRTDRRKWEGLTAENMAKHGLTKIKNDVCITDGGEIFLFGSGTCGLCQIHNIGGGECTGCPIDALGANCVFAVSSPYFIWKWSDNPQPMIDLLRKIEAGATK